MPRVPDYNEIHELVGGEVYIALPSYNDIHVAIALYSVSKFSTFEFCPTRCEYAYLHALSSPLGGVYKPLDHSCNKYCNLIGQKEVFYFP